MGVPHLVRLAQGYAVEDGGIEQDAAAVLAVEIEDSAPFQVILWRQCLPHRRAEAAGIEIMKEQVNEVLNDRDPWERSIINNRFGLDDKELLTLDELGNEFDITRERVSQIVKEVLQKIYSEDRGGHLREFIM